jgi:squalene cyclase
MEINEALKKTIFALNSQQKNGENWEGDIFYNSYPTSVRLILHKMIDYHDEVWEKKAIILLEKMQRNDGSWYILDKIELHPTINNDEIEQMLEIKASTIRNTISALLALELYDANKDCIEKAKKYLQNIDKALVDPFTAVFLAYFNRWSWKEIKIPPIEILLLPSNCKFGINRFIPVWIRDAAIGVLVFKTLCRNRILWSPLRQLALRKGFKLIKNNQLKNGSWFGTFQPTVYPVLALKMKEKTNNNIFIQKAFSFLFSKTNYQTGYVHRFNLPVWDTSFALIALIECGYPKTDNVFQSACNYLINAQLKKENNWGFAPDVTLYPDCDDTAVATYALLMAGYHKNYFRKTIMWLLYMQNEDGGWPAFTKNQAVKKKGTLPTSVEDSLTILRDPSVADITGHVIRTLSTYGYDNNNINIQRGIDFLFNDQLDNGSWYGRWGLCYIYGTTRVLNAFFSIGYDMSDKRIQKAINWLVAHQNKDGGWGEHFIAYFRESEGGIGHSTPCHTGWVLNTLIPILGVNNDIILRGVNYLLSTQNIDGKWKSSITVGALEIYENTLYSTTFPLLGLATFNKYKNEKEST